MKTDVCYWLNSEAVRRGVAKVACLNTAVEASTLAHRGKELLAQDRFISEHISAQDYLVVSVGGNDIALNPSLCTALNMYLMLKTNSTRSLERCACGCLPFAGCC